MARRRMISQRKRPKTRAQQMMERMQRRVIEEPEEDPLVKEMLKMMKRFDLSQEQVQQNIAMSVFGGGKLPTKQQKLIDLPPIKQIKEPKQVKIKPLTRAEKQKRKKTIKLKEEKPEDLREERIPQERATRATHAQLQFDQHRGIRELMGSSVVQYLDYDPETKVINVRLGASRRGTRDYHTTKPVSQSVFNRWKRGEATCRTDDKSGLKRWSEGDTPSLGAFFNVFIKGRYGLVRGLL